MFKLWAIVITTIENNLAKQFLIFYFSVSASNNYFGLYGNNFFSSEC